jgi:hypothetical protein
MELSNTAAAIIGGLALAIAAAISLALIRRPSRQRVNLSLRTVRLVGGVFMLTVLLGALGATARSPAPGVVWVLLMAAMLGPIGLQLVFDAMEGKWRKGVLFGWAVALSLLLLAGISWWALTSGQQFLAALPSIGFILIVWGALVVWATLWWAASLGRDDPDGMRPGYLIGGGAWSLMSVVSGVVVTGLLVAAVAGRSSSWQMMIHPQLTMLALPLTMIVPLRVLSAGLSRRADDLSARRWRRVLLIATMIVSIWGFLVGLTIGAFQQAAPWRLLTVACTLAAAIVAVAWIRNLRQATQSGASV